MPRKSVLPICKTNNMAVFVPVALDAIYLQNDLNVPGPMMDFSKIPWTDGTHDYNNDSPYLSKTLYREPFEDKGLRLQAGLHLHWAYRMPLPVLFRVKGKRGFHRHPIDGLWYA